MVVALNDTVQPALQSCPMEMSELEARAGTI